MSPVRARTLIVTLKKLVPAGSFQSPTAPNLFSYDIVRGLLCAYRTGGRTEIAQMKQLPPSVAVVGGGIGGLTAALTLLRAGFDVHVYEQAPALSEVGAGIQLAPNCTRILR